MGQWKRDGPGGCCCLSCWFWLDDFADGDLQQPQSGINNARWNVGEGPPPHFVNVAANGEVPGYLQGNQIEPHNLPVTHAMRVVPGPAWTQEEATSVLSRGYTSGVGVVGIFSCEIQVLPDGVAGLQPDGGTWLLLDRPSGLIYFAAIQPMYAQQAALVPVHEGIEYDFSASVPLYVELHIDGPIHGQGNAATYSFVLFINGEEVTRGRAAVFVSGGLAVAIPRRLRRMTDSVWSPPLLPGWVEHLATPAREYPTGSFKLWNMRYDATTRVAPPDDQCRVAATDYWVGFDDAVGMTSGIRANWSGTATVDSDHALPRYPPDPRHFAGGPENPPGTTIDDEAVQYYSLDVVRDGATPTGLRVAVTYRHRQQFIPAPPWEYDTFFIIFDGATEYTWPLRFAEVDAVVIYGYVPQQVYTDLFGSNWTLTLYQGTLTG